MTQRSPFTKQEWERIPRYFDYTDELTKMGSGVTLSSATLAGYNVTTGAADNTILSSTTATISGAQAQGLAIGGTAGNTYKITCQASFSNGARLEDDDFMKVEET